MSGIFNIMNTEFYRSASDGAGGGEGPKRMTITNTQFIIVTHSPILLGLPEAQILTFEDGPLHACEYEDTDSYQVTSMFINHREQLLGRLFEE